MDGYACCSIQFRGLVLQCHTPNFIVIGQGVRQLQGPQTGSDFSLPRANYASDCHQIHTFFPPGPSRAVCQISLHSARQFSLNFLPVVGFGLPRTTYVSDVIFVLSSSGEWVSHATHQISLSSVKAFGSYCVHRQTDRQTDRQTTDTTPKMVDSGSWGPISPRYIKNSTSIF